MKKDEAVAGETVEALEARMPLRFPREMVVALLALAAAWQLVSLFVPPFVVPGWQRIVKSLVTLRLDFVLITLARVVVALIVSFALGLGLAVLMYASTPVERYGRPIDAGDQKAAARLRATIHPFILRRTKSEVAKDLPEKIETDQICELTGEQASLYQAVLKEVRAQVMGEVERQGLAKSQIQILAGLTRLRQAACDPRLLGLPREFGAPEP